MSRAEQKNTIVFYHKNCTDGYGAAYSAWLKLGNTAYYVPVDYKPIQDMNSREAMEYLLGPIGIHKSDYPLYSIYVVDYAFPFEQFLDHCDWFASVIILDHHETAISNYTKGIQKKLDEDANSLPHYIQHDSLGTKTMSVKGTDRILFSSEMSGAKLTYHYFHFKEAPLGIELISDRDLGLFKTGDECKGFYLFLQSQKPWTFEQWNSLLDPEKINENIAIGQQMLIKRNHDIDMFIKDHSTEIKIPVNGEVFKGLAVNAPLEFGTDIGTVVYSGEYDFCLTWALMTTGKVYCSLRSKKEFSVSKIAEAFGGGGHKNAAGFTVPFIKFLEFLQLSEVEKEQTSVTSENKQSVSDKVI